MFTRFLKGVAVPTLATSSLYLYNRWKGSTFLKQEPGSTSLGPQTALPIYRPNDWIHLHYAVEVYKDTGGEVLNKEGWELVGAPHSEPNSYFGAAYRNIDKKHVIIANRGTQDLKDWITDLDFVTRRLNEQAVSAWDNFAKKIVEKHGPDYSYSFTGHSLGGLLSQVCLWKYQDEFVKDKAYKDAFAVTLDDPGAKDVLEALQPRVESSYRIATDKLDITAYLSRPHIINTALEHVGSTYALLPDMKLSWFEQKTVLYTAKMHSSPVLLKEFNKEEGLPTTCLRVIDWPKVNWGTVFPSTNSTKSALGYIALALKAWKAGEIERGEYTGFFTYSANAANPEALPPASQFQLKHEIHYRVKAFDEQVLPLRNMPSKMRQFLEDLQEYPNREKIINQLGGINKDVLALLMAYRINAYEELVLDKNKTTLSARAFREVILNFLNDNPHLYQSKLAVLCLEHIERNQQAGTLPGLLMDLREQSQHTSNLLYRLNFQQGTAKLYKFIKPTWQEMESIKEERHALQKQLGILQSLKLTQQSLKVDKEVYTELTKALQQQEQQLKLAQQSADILLGYMQGKQSVNEELDKFMATLPTLDIPLDKDLLLNRAYNLKAKIAAIEGNTVATEYYRLATEVLPNDSLTWSNYGGLLTDLGRAQKNPNLYVESYQCFQKVSLEQINPEQLPIVASGMAYGFILLAQSVEQQKIKPLEAKIPNKEALHKEAQNLLKRAIEINPHYLNARLFTAILCYDQGNYPVALQEINNTLSLQPNHPTALMRKGFILEKLDKLEEALEVLGQAKQRLENQGVKHNMGWIKEIEEHMESIQAQSKKVLKAKL